MLYAIVAIVVLILDQWTKYWASTHLELNTGIKELIPGIIHITNIHNEGASLGILQNAQFLFLIVLALFTAVVIFLLAKGIVRTPFGRWTLVLMLAGALGNGVDRAVFGYVVDMFEFEFFNFAIFNIADCLITFGGILFCVHVLFFKLKKGGRGGADESEAEEKAPRRRAVRRTEEEEDAFYQVPPVRPAAPVARTAPAGASRPAVRTAPAQTAARPAAPAQTAVRPAVPVARTAPAQTAVRPAVPAARAASAQTAARPAAPAARTAPAQAPARPAAPAARTAPAQAPARPAAPAQTAPRPAARTVSAPTAARPAAPAPAAKPADEFDLDSILAEFK